MVGALRRLVASRVRRWEHERGWLLVGLLLAFLGTALRLWLLTRPLGAVDSDEAVVGLMARHVLQGELPVFFWGQPYGGSIEAVMTAPLMAVAGSSLVTLKLIPLLLHVVAACLVWAIGREVADQRVALMGAALFWVAPAAVVYRSIQAYSFYASGLVLALAALLLIVRASVTDSGRNLLLLGLVLGVGWWTNAQIVPLIAPPLLWLLLRSAGFRRRVSLLAPGFVVGAGPWIASNLANDWHSLRLTDVGPEGVGYLDRFGDFFSGSVAMLLGLRLPISGRVLVPELVAGLVAAIAVGACIWAGARSGVKGRVLAAVVAGYPFVYALSPFTWYFDDARYVYFLWPVVALLLVVALFRFSPQMAGAVVLGLAAVCFVQVLVADQQEAARIGDGNLHPPIDLSTASGFLEDRGLTHVFTDYWIAYKLTFDGDERVIAASMGHVRYGPYQEEVRAAPAPAYVFVQGTEAVDALKTALVVRGVAFQELETQGMTVIVPERKVLPEEIPEVTTG